MECIKGFTEDEIRTLAEEAERVKRENGSLSEVFKTLGEKYGRAKGSVRNFYYEFIKMCAGDPSLKLRYFSDPPEVNRAKCFERAEEKELVIKILEGKKQNKSVRRTIMELSGGDDKLMLRYQNKYRNLIKNEPDFIDSIAEEMGVDYNAKMRRAYAKVPDFTLERLKTDINKLVENIAKSVRDENAELKKRAALLQQENEVLKSLLKKNETILAASRAEQYALLGDRQIN